MKLIDPLEKLRESMPPIFAGTEINKLTGGGYHWPTLRNEKSNGSAPADMFLRASSRKTLVIRDPFLEYWNRKIVATMKK